MTISRRDLIRATGFGLLLRGTALGAVGVLVPRGPTAAGGPRARRELDLRTATADTFRPYVGTTFRLKESDRRLVDVELSEVRAAPSDGRTDCFALRFRAARSVALHQNTYVVEHAELGACAMFLVPLGKDEVEAVVNHVRA